MSQLDEIRARIPNIPESDMSRTERDRSYLLATIDRVQKLAENYDFDSYADTAMDWEARKVLGRVSEELRAALNG